MLPKKTPVRITVFVNGPSYAETSRLVCRRVGGSGPETSTLSGHLLAADHIFRPSACKHNGVNAARLSLSLYPIQVTAAHFRPNFVVDGARAHEEDGWTTVSIGGGALSFRVTGPCSRYVHIARVPCRQSAGLISFKAVTSLAFSRAQTCDTHARAGPSTPLPAA